MVTYNYYIHFNIRDLIIFVKLGYQYIIQFLDNPEMFTKHTFFICYLSDDGTSKEHSTAG